MKKINLFSPILKLNCNLAIVGSSKSILKKNYGKKINNYKEVIRFNTAEVDKYKSFVGNKTTLRVINNNVFDSKNYPKLKNDFIFYNKLKNCKIAVISPFKFTKKNKLENINVLNEYFFCEGKLKSFLVCFYFIKNFLIFLNLIKLALNKNFSVGFLTILICISSGIKPDLFGFDLNESMKKRSYYWRNNFPIGNVHNLELEHIIIKMLLKKGLINLF